MAISGCNDSTLKSALAVVLSPPDNHISSHNFQSKIVTLTSKISHWKCWKGVTTGQLVIRFARKFDSTLLGPCYVYWQKFSHFYQTQTVLQPPTSPVVKTQLWQKRGPKRNLILGESVFDVPRSMKTCLRELLEPPELWRFAD